MATVARNVVRFQSRGSWDGLFLPSSVGDFSTGFRKLRFGSTQGAHHCRSCGCIAALQLPRTNYLLRRAPHSRFPKNNDKFKGWYEQECNFCPAKKLFESRFGIFFNNIFILNRFFQKARQKGEKDKGKLTILSPISSKMRRILLNSLLSGPIRPCK